MRLQQPVATAQVWKKAVPARLAVVCSQDTEGCGIAAMTRSLCDELEVQGHQVMRLDPRRGVWAVEYDIEYARIEHVSIQYIIGFYGKRWLGLNLMWMMLLLRAGGRRVVVTMHEVHGWRAPHHWVIERLVGWLASEVVVHSGAHEGVMGGRRIALGVGTGLVPLRSAPVRRSAAHPGDVIKVLFFGKINPAKGIERMLELVLAGYHVTVALSVDAGHTEYQRMLERMFGDRLVCKAWFTESEKRALFVAADVLVLPYKRVAYQSGVLADAGTYGIPVVVTEALAETVERFGIGEVVEVGGLAQGVERVVRWYGLYLAGLDRYRAAAGWPEAARQYAEVLSGAPAV